MVKVSEMDAGLETSGWLRPILENREIVVVVEVVVPNSGIETKPT